MKNQAIQYFALDMHQATVVAAVRDEQGTIRMRKDNGVRSKVNRFDFDYPLLGRTLA
jgi:hypothetical protein